ncbi:MAG: hypothetical protein ABDH21_06290 [bacterium]
MNKINSELIFNLYIKSINKNYNIPIEQALQIKDTVNVVNTIDPFDTSQYQILTSLLGSRLVPDFEYLFVTGLYFSLMSTIGGVAYIPKDYIQQIASLMSSTKDPLKKFLFDEKNKFFIEKPLSVFSTTTPSKVFEFLGNNFVGQAPFVVKPDQLPDSEKLLELLTRSQQINLALSKTPFLTEILKKEIISFLNEFSGYFSKSGYLKRLIEITENNYMTRNNINIWKKLIESAISVLSFVSEFTKPIQIKSEKELKDYFGYLNLLNWVQKNPHQFYQIQQNIKDERFAKLISNFVSNGYNLYSNREELIKTACNSLYSIIVGIVASHFKKAIKSGDLKNGDGFYFLQLYTLSSALIDMINNGKTNTTQFYNIKYNLKSMMISKSYLFPLVQILDSNDNSVVISALEVIRRIGQKVAPWVIQKSPNMPKDKSFWLRLNLWTKIYQSLDKNDPNYQQYRNYMIKKLRSILNSYSDAVKLNSFLNNFIINQESFDIVVKNLDSMLNTIGGYPIASTYENPDYLFSQVVRLNFLTNQNANQSNIKYKKDMIHNEFINKIMHREPILSKLVTDYNEYNLNLRNNPNLKDNLYKVIQNYYQASMHYL